tara:strand:- start:530 stop:1102 length:573 start_codon:yes stop_codon:yes gene_type:complete
MIRALILLAGFLVAVPTAQAQSGSQSPNGVPTLQNPAVLQRLNPQSTAEDNQDDANDRVPSRQVFDDAQQDQRRRDDHRPVRGQVQETREVLCRNVTAVELLHTELQITCSNPDQRGNHVHTLWLDTALFVEQEAAGNEQRRWLAARLIEAVELTRQDPNAHLSLTTGTLTITFATSARDITGFTIRYSD